MTLQERKQKLKAQMKKEGVTWTDIANTFKKEYPTDEGGTPQNFNGRFHNIKTLNTFVKFEQEVIFYMKKFKEGLN